MSLRCGQAGKKNLQNQGHLLLVNICRWWVLDPSVDNFYDCLISLSNKF